MKKVEFERILDQCLARMESGEAIVVILKDHNLLAAELEPLLTAAQLTKSLPEIGSAESMREGRNRLLAEVDEMKKRGAFLETEQNLLFSVIQDSG